MTQVAGRLETVQDGEHHPDERAIPATPRRVQRPRQSWSHPWRRSRRIRHGERLLGTPRMIRAQLGLGRPTRLYRARSELGVAATECS